MAADIRHMSQRVLSVLVSRITAVVLLVLLGLPARGYTSVDEAKEAIGAIAVQAISDMGEVADEFASAVQALSTPSAITAAEGLARDEVDAQWSQARVQIDDIRGEYPSELAADANAAKQAIQQAHQEVRSDITDLKTSAFGQLGITTTTTTTSTTAAATTTTTATPRSGGAPPPKGPPSTTDGLGSVIETDSPFQAESTEDYANSIMAVAIPDVTDRSPAMGSTMKAMGAETTSTIALSLEVFLPPAIAELVLSPLLVIEILGRTAFEGGWGILLPLGLLVASGALLVRADRRIRRSAIRAPSNLAP